MISLTLRVRRVAAGVSVSLWKGQDALVPEGAATAELSAGDLKTIRTALTDGQNLTEKIPQFARTLGAMLLPPPVLAKWQQESQALAAGDRLVTILDVEDSLQSYPWEIAWARERLFLRPDRPFLRQALAGGGASAKSAWPVDMLIVLGSSKEELQAIDGYGELRRIRDALRERNRFVHLRVLDLSVPDPLQPTATGRQRVSNALLAIKPQVLHFIGHGTDNGLELFQPRAPGGAGPAGTAVWTTDAIAADLKFTPWLVYLNACRSLGGGQASPTQFSTLAAAFLDKGARAVVAMHADISGPSAAVCAEQFYKTLAAGGPVDVALAQARAEVDRSIVGSEAGVLEMAEPYLPVLMVAGDPEGAIPCFTDRYQPPKTVQISKGHEIATVVQELVNQDIGRRELLGWPLPESGHSNAIAVHGPPSSGKSWLLAWCMDGWLRREYIVRYHTMAGHRHWFDAMNAILLGDPAFSVKSPPLAQARDLFVEAMGSLLAPTETKAGTGKAGASKKPIALKPANKKRLESEIAFVGQCFASALEQAAGETPLVIVLDQFEMPGIAPMDAVTFKLLYTHWIQPHVLERSGPVRVVLGLPKTLAETYEVPDSILKVPLDAFPAERYVELVDELLRARYAAKYAAVREVWEVQRSKIGQHSKLPADLSNDCNAIYTVLSLMAGGRT